MPSLIAQARDALARDDLVGCLTLLRGSQVPRRHQNELLLHEASLQRLREDARKGLRDDESLARERRRLTAALLELLDLIAADLGQGTSAIAPPLAPTPAPAPADPPAFTLTLQLSPTPDGARVRWSADTLDAFSSTFVSPYHGADLAAVLGALEGLQHPAFAPAQETRTRLRALGLVGEDDPPPDDLARQVGRELFRALVSGQGIAALTMARSQAAQRGQALALNLLFPPDAAELAALPWELLWDERPGPLLLSTTPRVLLTRHLELPDPLPAAPPQRGRPLRILAFTPRSQQTADDHQLLTSSLDQLWESLEQAGIATVTTVTHATRAALARAASERYDIVQFTGQGWYAEGRGVLFCDPEAPGAPPDRLDADQVAVALRGARMVVLAACRSAHGANVEGPPTSVLTGVAPALSAAGVPVVVGMQLGVRLSAALHACQAIYQGVAAGLSVQIAVGRAREELYVAEVDRASWYVPALYLRTRSPGSVVI